MVERVDGERPRTLGFLLVRLARRISTRGPIRNHVRAATGLRDLVYQMLVEASKSRVRMIKEDGQIYLQETFLWPYLLLLPHVQWSDINSVRFGRSGWCGAY